MWAVLLHPDAHLRIARKVARDIGRADLSPTLEYYSVIPDKWRDFPHHTGGRGLKRISKRILRARNNYLQGFDQKAAAELGVAFHYIADEHVLIRGSDSRHASYELKISRAPLNVQKTDSFEGKEATFEYINEKMSELRKRLYLLTPEAALSSAYEMCISIAKSVFGSKISSELQHILIELRKAYTEKMKMIEEEFVNKLLETAKKEEEFEKSKGIKRLANKIIKILSFSDFRFQRNIEKYKKRRHLENTVKSYYKEAALESRPYKDWYIIEIPELSIYTEEVKPKLLPIEHILETFGLDGQRINELKKETKISPIILKGEEFIKEEDIQKIMADVGFESMMHIFIDARRLERALYIEDSELRIDKETKQCIEATVRDYHIIIDLETKTILHDCPDWIQMLTNKRFCKHIGKLLLSMDRRKATELLRTIYAQRETWQFKPYIHQEQHVKNIPREYDGMFTRNTLNR